MAEATQIDPANKQAVAVRDESIVVLYPPAEMSKPDALLFAAWIVAMAETEDGEFQKYRDAVEST
jgi:hypothetical protein